MAEIAKGYQTSKEEKTSNCIALCPLQPLDPTAGIARPRGDPGEDRRFNACRARRGRRPEEEEGE